METTDLHCHVQPYDYYADKPDDTVGPRAHRARSSRRSAPRRRNTLLVDNGDYLQGNPMGDYIAYKRGMKAGDIHPVIAGDEHARLRRGHARQPRVQLRRRLPRPRRRRRRVPDRLRQLRQRRRRAAARRPAPAPYVILDREVVGRHGRGARRSRSASSASCRRRSCSGTAATSTASSTTRDIVEAARGTGAGDARGRRRHRRRALPFRHRPRRRQAAMRRERLAAARRRCPASTPSSPATSTGLPVGKDFAGIAGVDAAKGHAQRRAGGHGRLLGLPSGLIDLMLEQDGDGWRVAGVRDRAPGRSTSATRTAASSPLVDGRAGARRRPQAVHEATLAYVRQPVGEPTAPLNSYFALVADDPSVQIVARRRSGTSPQLAATGTELQGPAASSPPPRRSSPAAAAGRTTTPTSPAGPIAIKNVADIYLYPNTRAGGEGHRRRGAGVAGALGRHLQPHRPGRTRRAAADRPGLPGLQLRRHRRRDLRDRRDPALPLRRRRQARRRRTRTASSTCASTASRSTTRRSSSSPPTTTAPAAAATSPAPTARRSCSTRPTPTATSSSATSCRRRCIAPRCRQQLADRAASTWGCRDLRERTSGCEVDSQGVAGQAARRRVRRVFEVRTRGGRLIMSKHREVRRRGTGFSVSNSGSIPGRGGARRDRPAGRLRARHQRVLRHRRRGTAGRGKGQRGPLDQRRALRGARWRARFHQG